MWVCVCVCLCVWHVCVCFHDGTGMMLIMTLITVIKLSWAWEWKHSLSDDKDVVVYLFPYSIFGLILNRYAVKASPSERSGCTTVSFSLNAFKIRLICLCDKINLYFLSEADWACMLSSAVHYFKFTSMRSPLGATQCSFSHRQLATGFLWLSTLLSGASRVVVEREAVGLLLVPGLYWHGEGVKQGPGGRGPWHKNMGGYEGVRQGDALRQSAGHGAWLPCCGSLGT